MPSRRAPVPGWSGRPPEGEGQPAPRSPGRPRMALSIRPVLPCPCPGVPEGAVTRRDDDGGCPVRWPPRASGAGRNQRGILFVPSARGRARQAVGAVVKHRIMPKGRRAERVRGRVARSRARFSGRPVSAFPPLRRAEPPRRAPGRNPRQAPTGCLRNAGGADPVRNAGGRRKRRAPPSRPDPALPEPEAAWLPSRATARTPRGLRQNRKPGSGPVRAC